MASYLLRRLLIAIPSLLGISLILFTVLAMAPGDPFQEMATNPNVPPQVREALRESFGLNDPVMVRYLRWLAAMAKGDWGFSFASRIDVDDLILQRVPTTLFIVGSSQILALAIALPVGIYAATRPYSVFDQIANTLAFVGFSLPTFFTGLLFILIFSVQLDWFPFVTALRSPRPAGAGTGRCSARRSCRSAFSASSRLPPTPATYARPCSTSCGWTT
jgi:peptide/nickel transport system permease protein